MVYKGQVIDIDANYAIVLTEEMEYKRVVKKQNMCIGMPIIFLKEDIYINHKVNLKALYGIAAVFIFILVSVGVFSKFNYIENVTASIVSIDINPSIELSVNQKGLVTDTKSLNEEGSSILREIPMGLELSETVICILNNAYAAHYLDQEDSTILIAFVALNKNGAMEQVHQQEKIKSTIDSHAQFKSTTIEYIFTHKDSIETAHENDLSIGRYGLYENLKDENQSITVTSIKEMHIGELLRRRNRINQDAIETKDEIEEDWPIKYRHGLENENDAVQIFEPNDNGNMDGDSKIRQRVRQGQENQGGQTPSGNEEQAAQESVQSEEIIVEFEVQPEEAPAPEGHGHNPMEEGNGHEGQNSDDAQDQNGESSKSLGGENKGDCKNPERSINKK
jgi:hypothetical protein